MTGQVDEMKKKSGKNEPLAGNQTKRTMGSLALCVLAAIAFAVLLYAANYDRPVYRSRDTSGTEYEVARVLRVLEDKTVEDEQLDGIWRGSMVLEVAILSGRYAGQTAVTTNYFSALYNVRVRQGDKLSVRIDTTGDGRYEVSVYNYYRVPGLFACVGVFVLLMIAVGGKKGAKSVLGILFTMICLVWILLPLALKGYPALWVTIGIILACNFVSFVLIDGIQTKTMVASVGSICGVLAGAVFAAIAGAVLSVSSYQTDEAETLILITSTTQLSLRGLFLCGILIACMGAVMDVAMSIVSSIAEIHMLNPERSAVQLFASGMNIGRDALGTMSNTLILAFAGNSFHMMLMIYSYGVSFEQLMNTDFVAVEVIRGMAGSIGIICAVPASALIAAAVYGRRSPRRKHFSK